MNRLSHKALELIAKQLEELSRLDGKLDKDDSLALVRYFNRLMEHKKTKSRIIDEERKKLSKLSTKELRELVKEGK